MFTNIEKKSFLEAVAARDHRFDGRFFVGVKTTGVYCRPVCPAKPLPKNMVFFATAMAAELEGFRPCMRCRPEVAPFSPAWLGKSAVVRRALTQIGDGRLFEKSEDDFAASFGMTARHLRRLFVKEIGATPKQVSDNQRLNFARSLLLETTLPMVEVAYSAGFGSLRRFNDAMIKRFEQSPSQLRKARNSAVAKKSRVVLRLSYRPPFDWETLLGFIERHMIFGTEQVVGKSYRRLFVDPHSKQIASVLVENEPQQSALKVTFDRVSTNALFGLCRDLRAMFDLDSDPLLLAQSFARSATLRDLVKRYPGLRVPRGWDAFEMAVGTILGQLVSVTQAQRLMLQLIENYGEKVVDPHSCQEITLFPTPEKLLAVDLLKVKTTQKRRETIHSFCQLLIEDRSWFQTATDYRNLREKLLSIKGIGPWSVEYICLRAFGDTDAFPSKDLIIGRALAAMPEVDHEVLRPWRSYLTLYLWKSYIAPPKTRKPRK